MEVRRKRTILVVVLGLLALGSGLAGYGLLRSAPSGPLEADTVEATETNTRVYQAFAAAGFTDVMADVTPERALVRYNVPEGVVPQASWFYAFTVLTVQAPHSEEVVLEVHRDFQPFQRVSVPMDVLLQVVGGEMDAQELKEAMRVESLE